MTYASCRTVSIISKQSYGTEDYVGPYLLNLREEETTEGGTTIILVSSIPDRGDQDETSSIEGSGAPSSKISISDDRQGDIEVNSTFTRESTQTALLLASLYERDEKRKARLFRCSDAISRPEQKKYARRFLLHQQVDGIGQSLLDQAIDTAEKKLPQATEVNDKVKASS